MTTLSKKEKQNQIYFKISKINKKIKDLVKAREILVLQKRALNETKVEKLKNDN